MIEVIARLDSGLTVAVDPMPTARSVAVGVWVGVGARDEPEDCSGVSHFLEHLLFKGTATRTAQDISTMVDRVGGDINAFTSKEYTAYYCRLPARDLGRGIDLLADVVIRPALRTADIDSEREVILEELAMDDDSPDDVAHRIFGRQLFGMHPLGRDTAGDAGTIASLSAADVRRFHADHYRAGNTVVAVAGAADPHAAIDQVASAFAELPAGTGCPTRRAPGTAGCDLDLDDDCEQVHLVIGQRSLPREDPDRESLDVVNHVLGGGLSSRLFDEIRERRGLAYSVFSTAAAYADAGSWSVYAGTLPRHRSTVRGLIEEAISALVADGITDDELDIAIGALTGSYELGLEDPGARMSRLGGSLVTTGRLRTVDEQLARWCAVDHASIRRVIDRVYGSATPITVTVGPEVASTR